MEAFLKNLAEAIHRPGMEISPDDPLADLPGWDSLAVLTTISMLDQEYGVLISGPDIQSCLTVRDLYQKTRERRGDNA